MSIEITDQELNQVYDEFEAMRGGANPFYRTKRVHTVSNGFYELSKRTVNLELSDSQMDFFKANKNVDELFNHIYDTYIKHAANNLRVQIVVFLPGLFDRPLSTSYTLKSQFSPANILDVVDRAVQSKKPEDFDKLKDNSKMKIVVTFAKIVQGGAKKRKHEDESESDDEIDAAQSIVNLNDYCRTNRFITVYNRTNCV
jgi:hypothetical protein